MGICIIYNKYGNNFSRIFFIMRAETGIKKAEGVGVEPTGDDTSRLPTVLKTARATGPYPLPGLLYG
ncbi:MAG: hypothetical protein DRP46_10245 [Candidatus Zixiibacteriota bacterium]|nr:MAG: hypothetical protein DRP46_10245 [candidate division Zixibacteria bacterium]